MAAARAWAAAAIQLGSEVQVCDGDDRLVFHSRNGQTIHWEGFWEAVGN